MCFKYIFGTLRRTNLTNFYPENCGDKFTEFILTINCHICHIKVSIIRLIINFLCNVCNTYGLLRLSVSTEDSYKLLHQPLTIKEQTISFSVETSKN